MSSLSQSPLSSPKKKIVLTLSALGVLGVVALVSSGGIPGLSSSVLGGSTCTQESLTANKSAYENIGSQIETLGGSMGIQNEQIEKWKEKISEHKKDISEKKNDIKATKRSIQSLKSYIAKSCGKKKGPMSGVPKDCPAKTNQLSNEEAKVRKLEESVKNRNESIKKLQVNIRNAQTALNSLQGQISTAENFQAEYEACEEEVSAGGISAPETGGDLPINQPETGGNLPINNTTENDADEPGTPIAPVNTPLNSAPTNPANTGVPPANNAALQTGTLPAPPAPSNTASSLTMEVNTPTKMDDWEIINPIVTNGGILGFSDIFKCSFSNNQTLLGMGIDGIKSSPMPYAHSSCAGGYPVVSEVQGLQGLINIDWEIEGQRVTIPDFQNMEIQYRKTLKDMQKELKKIKKELTWTKKTLNSYSCGREGGGVGAGRYSGACHGSVWYTHYSLTYGIPWGTVVQYNISAGSGKVGLKNREKGLKKSEKIVLKRIEEMKQNIKNIGRAIAAGIENIEEVVKIKNQILSNPKIIATNTHQAHSVTQSGNAGNQIELYQFSLQTDLTPVSVVDRIVFEVHSSSSSVSFSEESIQLIEKSSSKPVLNCLQRGTTKRIIDCLPILCTNKDRDCQPVLRDKTPHEYVLVGKLENSMTSGSYAINKVDGILYNLTGGRIFNTDIINNTRPIQTIFTAQ